MSQASEYHQQLIAGLSRQAAWPESVSPDQVIETHISTVLLVGCHAYKIKKPLDLGFLDFSTLEKRRHCCQEEIRLNSRLAPDVYLDVIPIGGSPEHPRPFSEDHPIEYAVRMRRFDQAGLLSEHPHLITTELIDRLAERLASFHASIPSVPVDLSFGLSDSVALPMRENFTQIKSWSAYSQFQDQIERLSEWTDHQVLALAPQLSERRVGGFIRECHGDLHLGNIALEGDELLIFDGIEFNPALRWIDVISELAFLLMDLDEKGLNTHSQQLLNHYLELSGDYHALHLLRFYQVYRAMVRAKVCTIRLAQSDLTSTEQSQLMSDLQAYIDLALSYSHEGLSGVVITHGFSGSGKSTITSQSLKQLPAVRVRSDIERRRLVEMAFDQASHSAIADGLYRTEMTELTYQRLEDLARMIVKAGWIALIDATFLQQSQRVLFYRLAEELNKPFVILDLQVPFDELERRIEHRIRQGKDPSEATLAVLQHQRSNAEDLSGVELSSVVAVINDQLPVNTLVAHLEEKVSA